MSNCDTKPTNHLSFGHILFFIVIILLSGNYISFGQKEVVLNFQHRKYEERTRQLVFYQNFNNLAISTKDTTIFFYSSIPMFRENRIIKLDGWNSYTIPIDDILVIKKGKDYVKSMGQIILSLSVVPLIASGVYWITGNSEEALNGLIFSATVATISLLVITNGELKSKYNMKRWKLVSISNHQ